MVSLILAELDFSLMTPSMIFSENQLAILITHHPEFHAWTKHINIAVHFLHDHVKKRILDLYYINTEYNIGRYIYKGTQETVTY